MVVGDIDKKGSKSSDDLENEYDGGVDSWVVTRMRVGL